jgi:hypothetical protein
MARPILPWRSPLVLQPADGDTVWIRRLPWYDAPVRAAWNVDEGATVNITVATNPTTIDPVVIPLAAIHSWKFQFLHNETAYQNSRGPYDPH